MVRRSLYIYALLVFALFFMLAMTIYCLTQLAEHRMNSDRLQRIENIYSSLQLDDSYRPVKQDVFGEKQSYEGDSEWAKGRSRSSSVEYSHLDTPDNTRAELMKKIEAAGFKKIGGAYEGSIAPQDHFKNSQDEYIRLSVTNKLIQDEMIYGPGFTDLRNPARRDRSVAPSYITIKVNLDDNNE